MAYFRVTPSSRSAYRRLKIPFPDITAFDAAIRSLMLKNPLGCTSYIKGGKNHHPIEKVREMYTAKFAYEDSKGKRIGSGLDTYNSVEGYYYGIAAVISNMANNAAHGGKVYHIPESDHFSVLLKCHDPEFGYYSISIARHRLTLSSYQDDEVLARVGRWADEVSL
jgi:hypothetical protein